MSTKLESAIFWSFITSLDGSRVVQVRDDHKGQFVAKSDYLALRDRFQRLCKHDGGKVYSEDSSYCAVCGLEIEEDE